MRKLFLTSGLVLCLAYPAFADIAAGTSTAGCDESVLGSYTGPVDFTSEWRPIITGAITLDSKRYTSNNGSSVQNPTTNSNPTTVYALYGVGVYNSQPTVATISGFTTSNRYYALTTNPSMTGYTFAGFYTTKATGGTQVVGADGYFIYDAASTQVTTENGSATWYARWTANTYTILFGCGSAPSGASTSVTGSGPSSASAVYNSSYGLAESYGTCALQGYTATGWDCSGGATLTNATGSQSTWTSAANIVCTVHWTANTIGLNFYQDENATTPFTTDTCTYDSTFDLPTNYQPKPGYHFNGWIVRQ